MNTELLGEVVTWDLRSTEVSYQKVIDALASAGLDPEIAGEMSPSSAFGRACKHLKDARAIDKVKVDHGIASFQFTKKHLADCKIDYDFECIVTLDMNSGAISCPENSTLERQAQELLAHAVQTRNAQDVTRLVQKMFETHADLFPINPRKGVAYFVPEQHREFTTKVDTFLATLGGCLSRFPVPKGTQQGNASVKEAVQNGLSAVLSELNEAVGSWDETTRKTTMERASERMLVIKHKIEAYGEYLESEQDRLKEGLAVAMQQLKEKILTLKPEDQPEVAA